MEIEIKPKTKKVDNKPYKKILKKIKSKPNTKLKKIDKPCKGFTI